MKDSIFKSFRFEVVLYSLLSLIYALLSEAALFFGIYIIYNIINRNDVEMNQTPIGDAINNGINASNSANISNSGFSDNVNIPNNVNVPDSGALSNEAVTILVILGVVIGIVLFTVYLLLLTKKFVTYLEEISQGITQIASGNFHTRVSIKNEDEFTIIATKLNKMAEDINVLIENNQKNENTKNELITSVAHDLRTPLTSIIGYLDLVSKDGELTQEMKHKYIEIAYNKSMRLEKLIEDLFAYTKVTFGEVTMEFTDINLVKLIDQLLDEFYPSFQEYGLDSEFSTNLSTAVVRADGAMLARAFANLMSNAIKYGKDGKLVKIKLTKSHGKFTFVLTNYGTLIPEEDLPYIFDRFYRVEGSRSSETGGTGLGLAIAKSIILAHGGNITAKSDFEGTVFEVVLDEKKEGK
ncbi:MAG: two-component sensor histidine kinase [Anaerocolumna sp.]|nr:two-component sensor histidine kinase [Anaerocolumna sp.]